MKYLEINGYLSKALLAVAGLAVLALALIGSFYLIVAAMVIGFSTVLFSKLTSKPQPVKAKYIRGFSKNVPLNAEYRVVTRK